MARTIRTAAGYLVAAVGLCACGAARLAESATPGVIEGLAAPESERAVAELLQSEPVRSSIADLSEAVVDGSLQRLSAPERVERLDTLTARLVSSVGRALGGRSDGRGVSPDVERAVSRTLATAIDGVVDEMETERAQRVVHSLVNATVAELARGVRDELGPAAAQALRDDIAPAVAASLDDDMNRTLARTARVVAREGARGAEEALLDGPLVGTVTEPIEELGRIGWTIAVLLAIAILGGLGAVVVALRRQRIESRRHEALATMIASAVTRSRAIDWSRAEPATAADHAEAAYQDGIGNAERHHDAVLRPQSIAKQ